MAQTIAAGNYQLELRSGPFANLAYQLDCMADLMPCSGGAYRALWKGLGWDAQDDAAIESWRNMRSRWSGEFHRKDVVSPENLPFPDFRVQSALSARLSSVPLVAADSRSYEGAMALLVGEADARQLGTILSRFEPRFRSWWDRDGRAITVPFFEGSRKVIEEEALGDLVGRVAAFYETDPSAEGRVVIELLARPALADSHTSASQLGRYFPSEVLPGEQPRDRLDVVLHELFHYFHENMRSTALETLLRRFESSASPKASVAYSLLNETLAAGWGNGVVGKRLQTPEIFQSLMNRPGGLYADQSIDASAKGVLPFLEAVLPLGGTISSEPFFDAYLAAVEQAVPEPGARDYLRDHFAVLSRREYRGAARAIRSRVRSGSVSTFIPIDEDCKRFARQYPLLSGLIMASAADLSEGKLDGLIPGKELAAIKKAAGKTPFGWVVQRTPKSVLFVVIGRDATELESMAGKIPDLTRVVPGRMP